MNSLADLDKLCASTNITVLNLPDLFEHSSMVNGQNFDTNIIRFPKVSTSPNGSDKTGSVKEMKPIRRTQVDSCEAPFHRSFVVSSNPKHLARMEKEIDEMLASDKPKQPIIHQNHKDEEYLLERIRECYSSHSKG